MTISDPIARVNAAFPHMERARKRLVREGANGGWVVFGDERLGDAYPQYLVELRGRAYECSCYAHSNGDVRRGMVCSHVKAVVLWRAKRRVIEKAKARVRAKALERTKSEALAAAQNPDPSRTEALVSVEHQQRAGSSLSDAQGQGTRDTPVPPPSDPRFGPVAFPDWVQEFRAGQWDAIEQARDAFARGCGTVFINAPTGAGKSLIGETTRRVVDAPAIYMPTTKHLQNQLASDFPYASVLMGRANYTPTSGMATNLWGREVEVEHGGTRVTCADCTVTRNHRTCRWCPVVQECPYNQAKAGALMNPLAVLNTSYFLTESNGPGRFAGRGLVIADEADLLEQELMGYVEVRISPSRQKKLGITPPERKTVEESWVEWAGETLQTVGEYRAAMGPMEFMRDAKDIREAKGVESLIGGLSALTEELPKGGWIYDYESGDRQGDIAFKPIRVDRYGQEKLWRHASKWLLMSATIISADQMVADLGITGDWEVVDVPMSFPKENRPVHIVSVVEMSKKNETVAWPQMAPAVAGVCRLHEGERVLVHTVSYSLAKYVSDYLKREFPRRTIVTYTNGKFKDGAIAKYLNTPGAVMVAPSMDRGVDLPDASCRVQVIAKIPFPNLGDKQVNARLRSKGGQSWYAVQTVRTIVQMLGRGVRSESDHCESYILDSQWTTNVWHKNRRLFPKWFTAAIDWRFSKHLLQAPS